MTYGVRGLIKLTINWTIFLEDSLEPPKTVPDAVNRLMTVLNDEQKVIIATMQEGELIGLHFSLGTDILYSFNLHDQNSLLLKSCGSFVHPDDASGVIITKLWERLKYGD